MSTHTIVLCQFGNKLTTRQWSDYETVEDAMDGICQMYEHRLKKLNPNRKKITYDISDLFNFVDDLPDLSALVFNARDASYTPRNKEWIKDRVFQHLKKQAGQ
mmetsp:Transcript_11009/g.15841  ORF Transcript_11009/g.15841 Transcript_11009/m.15841 type:complete len:103 (-) Transcript_11009:60-368(-)|eukprot:CAMPEP_0175104670 /NCGR_PEP_ID=MMETSP0086_2-20121207/9895_1 /TAXON_ID=136419 /ORGANISM="Unknown Unknown, Strain D1" /LENGTH=102 /DNA_ID=CAMNT_0016380165 /DNA_START=40 /DNA_END=348 /DNA_ORIENTATION=+